MTSPLATRFGRVTLPAEAGCERATRELAELWGADSVRDSDGTELSREILAMGLEVYSTLCLVRADQDWNHAHRQYCQRKALMSDPVVPAEATAEIDLLAGYCREEFEVDPYHDPKRWWQVIDRATGEIVPADRWSYDAASGRVTVRGVVPFHPITVNFIALQLWDSVSFYNAITNDWKGRAVMPVDPRYPECRAHLLAYLERWLADHPSTRVVRLTSIAYDFAVMYNERKTKRFLDWCGYLDCFSPLAFEEFEREKGYALTLEDIVDAGRYNETNRVPTSRYLDWMDFVQAFVLDFARECVDRIHRAGREAMVFFCDHWIGAEPFSPAFRSVGFDRIANPCINGVQARRIAEVPGPIVSETRLYPYFFPTNLSGAPSFAPGGDPAGECRSYWMAIRRAMLRALPDRISWGGYLSLAVTSAPFIQYAASVCAEFRGMHERSKATRPATAPFKVAVLNAWGEIRRWINEEYKAGGLMEALSGLPFEVEFINFDDVVRRGIPEGVGVVINTGDAGTAWSGGVHWTNPEVVSRLRAWVHAGGGFIGVGEPSAAMHQGNYFQLVDVLGVDREIGQSRSVSTRRPKLPLARDHFILRDAPDTLELGTTADLVYPLHEHVVALDKRPTGLTLTTHRYGAGRSVYFAGFAYNSDTTRLLLRALYWAASQEDALTHWFSSNPRTECTAFPEVDQGVVLNHGGATEQTTVSAPDGRVATHTLPPYGHAWFKLSSLA